MNTRILTFLGATSLLLAGCGGRTPVTAQPFDKLAFVRQYPAAALHCTGQVDSANGMICDSADGQAYYQHYQAHVEYDDASFTHGTMLLSLENGIIAPGLHQTVVLLPHTLGIREISDVNDITNWCSPNGITMNVQGYQNGNTSGKELLALSFIDAPKITNVEKVFPDPVYADAVVINVSMDLCAIVTAKPTLTIRF